MLRKLPLALDSQMPLDDPQLTQINCPHALDRRAAGKVVVMGDGWPRAARIGAERLIERVYHRSDLRLQLLGHLPGG